MSPSHNPPSPELDAFLATHRPGDTFRGHVTSIVAFGAFVELSSGVDALLHTSEWHRGAPSINDEVDVRIVAMDTELGRISLALV